MKAKLIIVGAGGRMGKRILAAAIESGQFEIAAAIEKKGHPDTGKDAGLLIGGKALNVKVGSGWPAGGDSAKRTAGKPDTQTADKLVIDFSQPEAVAETLEYCVKNKSALVMGTTGLGTEAKEQIKAASAKVPILYSTNMSVGVNVLFSLAGEMAVMLGEEYDIEIVEQHHRFKKDVPSGTAITLAENICKATGRDFSDAVIYGRSGKDALRKKGQIAIHAVRAGDITGIHSVIFSTVGETITVNHTAHNPDSFAKGAVRAAEWLIGKNPGLYSMADVLGIKTVKNKWFAK